MSFFSQEKLEQHNQKKSERSKAQYSILLVDDEERTIESLKNLLDNEYHVLCATSGEVGLEIIIDYQARFKKNIDLIISDQCMPQMTGVEFLENSIQLTPNTIRFILTGYADMDSVIAAINKGHVYRFLMKPLEAEDIRDSIKLAIDEQKSQQTTSNHLESSFLENEFQRIERKMTQLKIVNQNLNKEIKILHDINLNKVRFFQLLAHDLKSPFNSLLGFSQMLHDNFDSLNSHQVKNIGQKIYPQIKSLYGLIENLLHWGNLQLNKIEINPQKINLKDLIDSVLFQQEIIAQKKSITLENKISLGVLIQGDTNILQTVVRNLLSNAIKFTPIDGTIEVTFVEEDDVVTVCFQDSGVGMSPEIIKNIFIFDKKQDNTVGTLNEQGNGLGLILCYEFIKLHYGKMWIESQEEKGTHVFFQIPKQFPSESREVTNI